MPSVAIVGFASNTREGVRQSKADEVWSLNTIHSSPIMRDVFPLEIDRLFEIHPFWLMQMEWYAYHCDHWKWITETKHPYPIYLIEAHPDIHNGVRYPIEDVSRRFLSRLYRGDDLAQYYTSSFCYMMGLALLEEFDRIEVYGFEMGSTTEYVYQKSGAEFWIGLASQHADVVMHPRSMLIQSKLYGFEGGQLVEPEVIKEYRSYYAMQADELALQEMTPENWIKTRLNTGALDFCMDLQAKGETISRQLLEGYKNTFATKVTLYSANLNAMSARAFERAKINDDGKVEEVGQEAFEVWRMMYQYEGAYQVALKLIRICDLQEPDKKLVNRFKWHEFEKGMVKQ